MKRRFSRFSAGIVVLLAALAGCEQKPETSVAAKGEVKASAAYLEHFGSPPTPKEGTCYARVGFYPLSTAPEKVRAVPFFIYREEGQLQQLLGRIAGGDFPLPSGSGLFDPFPKGTSVEVGSRGEGRVTLDLGFSGQMPAAGQLRSMVAALTETAVQYDGIDSVVILINGEPLPEAPADGYRHDSARIAQVGPPELFMVVADWRTEQAGPAEMAANFDRPVKIESFRLENADGQRIEGDYYQSVFDMSVIVHPDSPETIREGMTLRAHWDVADALGRKGKGSGEFRLQRHRHLDEHEATPVLGE